LSISDINIFGELSSEVPPHGFLSKVKKTKRALSLLPKVFGPVLYIAMKHGTYRDLKNARAVSFFK
jgi:hypothetical protein